MNYKIPNPAYVILAASIIALAFALILQFGFGVDPCELCLWQRVPYAVAGLVAIIALIIKPKAMAWLLGICAALFFADAGLALFHSGVERHWWVFHSACTSSVLGGSVEEMRQALLEKPVTRCDQIGWSVLGLSMANLNVGYAAVLGIFSLASFRKILSSAA